MASNRSATSMPTSSEGWRLARRAMTVDTYTTGQPGLLASHRMMPRDRDSMERVRGS